MRSLIILATIATTFGFTTTGSWVFLLLPPVAVTLVLILKHRWRGPDSVETAQRRNRERRGVHVQLAVALLVLSGLLTYSLVQHNRHSAVGYIILLAELAVLILLMIVEYVLALRRGYIARGDQPP